MMRFAYRTDTSAADWLVQSRTPWQQRVSLGPAGYEAYARLRFIPDPTWPGQTEADADVPDDRPSDTAQTARALHRLARFTATPQDCYFCVWEGYSDIHLPPAAPLVELPHRRYALFHGTIADIDAWASNLGAADPCAPPAFVWPADHAWCLASDVDPHWAGIGATKSAIDALVNDPDLDVVPTHPTATQPTY